MFTETRAGHERIVRLVTATFAPAIANPPTSSRPMGRASSRPLPLLAGVYRVFGGPLTVVRCSLVEIERARRVHLRLTWGQHSLVIDIGYVPVAQLEN